VNIQLVKNILSIDLEDHYCDLPFSTWDAYEGRVIQTTKIILELLEKYRASATFFTLGYIAERHPELIEEVRSKGHEIASHSYSHPDMRTLTRKTFEDDLSKSLNILSKLAGEKILGFRAPYFSIDRTNLWAFEVISERLRYDSSIFPVGPHYGMPNAPRHIYKTSASNPLSENPNGDFIEIPAATLRLPIIGNMPIGGGFHFRFLPLFLVRLGIKKMNDSGHAAMFYIHPEDLAPDRPRIPQYAWHYYYGLRNAFCKFESLLKTFRFTSARDVLGL
jgi:polysaccharide deacetylase family protein (PEP-CTERM system associated)